jgi:hypothetical protein
MSTGVATLETVYVPLAKDRLSIPSMYFKGQSSRKKYQWLITLFLFSIILYTIEGSIAVVTDSKLISAHKRLYPPHHKYNAHREVPARFKANYTFIRYDENLIEHADGIKVQEEGLKILVSGVYYVYCNVYINPDYMCKYYDDYSPWSFFVERITANNSAQIITLLQAAQTCSTYIASDTYDSKTSFIGGVFRLEAGDVIRVKFPKKFFDVFYVPESSFAGLVMLGPAN